MRHWRWIQRGLTGTQDFAQDTRGAIAILFALLIIPIVVLLGLAVDGLRALNAAETAHNALDASALAAARAMASDNLDDSQVERVAHDYFKANVDGTGKLPYASFNGFQVETDRNQGTVTVTVDTQVPTTFGQLAHVDNLTMRRSATASMGANRIELGLMLDVTGSMNRRGKLSALKDATEDLIDALVPENNTDQVRIGLAPYSASVNAGRFARVISDDESRDGCVVNREGSAIDSDTVPGRNTYFRSIQQANEDLRRDRGDTGYDFYECPDAEVLPLTGDRELLRATVNSYRADGRTAGHLGIAWAWYLVSPQWSSIWGGRPAEPYGADKVIKAVVLMTDGEFNAAYAGSESWGAAERESYDRTENLCNNIKREDVLVFSIAFDLRAASAERALADCATTEDMFCRAEDEDDLRRCYKDIAYRLSQLRITK